MARVGAVKPLCTRLAFQCAGCEQIFAIILPDGKYTVPAACSVPGCGSHNFTPQRTHRLTQTVDWQQIRLQGGIPKR